MFKQIVAFVFILAFAGQTFSKVFVVFDYFANKKVYVKKCVNKSRPGMHCNGKCQMMKKLMAEEKQEERNSERKAENKNENEIVLYNKSFFPSLNVDVSLQKIKCSSLEAESVIKMPRSIFRPPIC